MMPNIIEYTRSVVLVLVLLYGVSVVSAPLPDSTLTAATGQHSIASEDDMFDFDRLDQQLQDSGAQIGEPDKEPGAIEIWVRRLGMPIFLFLVKWLGRLWTLCSRLGHAVTGKSYEA